MAAILSRRVADLKTIGVSHIHCFYSNLAREGKISRDEAIRRSERESFSEARLKRTLELLEMDSL